MSEEKPKRMISTNWVKPRYVEPAPRRSPVVTTTSPYQKTRRLLTTDSVRVDPTERENRIRQALKEAREKTALEIEKRGGKVYRRTK